jgi:hypothetical protein
MSPRSTSHPHADQGAVPCRSRTEVIHHHVVSDPNGPFERRAAIARWSYREQVGQPLPVLEKRGDTAVPLPLGRRTHLTIDHQRTFCAGGAPCQRQHPDRKQVTDYTLGGGTFVENISRNSFHLPSARFQITMYFPRSSTLPALSRNSYSPTSVAVEP